MLFFLRSSPCAWMDFWYVQESSHPNVGLQELTPGSRLLLIRVTSRFPQFTRQGAAYQVAVMWAHLAHTVPFANAQRHKCFFSIFFFSWLRARILAEKSRTLSRSHTILPAGRELRNPVCYQNNVYLETQR